MFRPLALFVGLRYVRAKRSNHFISFISLISMGGIAVGVMALIVVMSVMNGFGNELRSRLLSLTAHARVAAVDGGLANWQPVADAAARLPQVAGSAPYVEGEAMLVNGANLSGVLVAGVSPAHEPAVSTVAEHMLAGSLDSLVAGERRVVLGVNLALTVGVRVGDAITLLVPAPNASGTGIAPRLERFTVSGVFEVGIQEHDSVRALVHIDDAAALYGRAGRVDGVRLRLDDLFEARAALDALAATLGDGYVYRDWTEEQATYFRAIRIEKTMMFIILLLIVAVAAFNIVATLVMVVTDKRNDIAILRTFGMTPGTVTRVFIVQGLVIGSVGVLLGVAGGVLVALNVEAITTAIESVFGKLIDPTVFYITDIPSDMRWPEVGSIGVAAFVLAALSTLYPARRAALVEPAEALRYE
ncbi:MAG: lipoprotein-releasing ABC transporter permease subunit [Pseudomonadota bacterium]